MKKYKLLLSFTLVILNLFAFWVLNISVDMFKTYIKDLYVLVISSLLFFMIFRKKNYLKPSSLFAISILIFIWDRVLISVFFPRQIVLAGTNINNYNLFYTIIVIGVGISCSIITMYLIENEWKQFQFLYSKQNTSFPKWLNSVIVIICVFFGIIFLKDSYSKIELIKSLGYLEIVGTDLLSNGIKYFRYVKIIILLWIFFGKDKNRFLYASIILLVSGIGFLMIGLRGYAISYFFLFLYFYNLNQNIKFWKLFLTAFGLLFVANKILEFRMGYNVTEGFFNVFLDTLSQQGASVEVVFGSVAFRKELLRELPIVEYLSGVDFGVFVDRVRNVGFEKGGFATSFYAEAYYLGIIPYIILSCLLGLIINILDNIEERVKKNSENQYAKILLFLIIPNLVYFARSEVFNLTNKILVSLFIIIILKDAIGKKYNKKEVTNENTI